MHIHSMLKIQRSFFPMKERRWMQCVFQDNVMQVWCFCPDVKFDLLGQLCSRCSSHHVSCSLHKTNFRLFPRVMLRHPGEGVKWILCDNNIFGSQLSVAYPQGDPVVSNANRLPPPQLTLMETLMTVSFHAGGINWDRGVVLMYSICITEDPDTAMKN